MGLVIKQGLYNTIFTYLGFFIGGLYTVLLVPIVFRNEPEYWGAARFLVSFAMIVVPWAQLSIPNLIIRYYPIFKKEKQKEFIFFVIFWTLIGLIISSAIVYIYLRFWFEDKDALVNNHIYSIFPIFIGFVLFEIATAISKSYFKSTIPVFLKEFFFRLIVMLIIVLYWYEVIDFELFLQLFTFNYMLSFFILMAYLLKIKALNFKVDFKIMWSDLFKPMYTYVAFSILTAGTAMILLNIDTLMINHYLTLTQVAIYGPSIYVAASILIPTRALHSIISPLVADAWVDNNIGLIKDLYVRSVTVPLIISSFMFLLIWLNIDLLMLFFGETFGQGKYVILYLGLGYLYSIITGINGTIITTSKYYKVELYFQLALVVLTVVMNIILIPILGIDGAALATAITFSVYNTFRTIFVYYRFKIHPYSFNTLITILIAAFFFIIISIMPNVLELKDGILYTVLFSVFYMVIVYVTKASEELNTMVKTSIKKLKELL